MNKDMQIYVVSVAQFLQILSEGKLPTGIKVQLVACESTSDKREVIYDIITPGAEAIPVTWIVGLSVDFDASRKFVEPIVRTTKFDVALPANIPPDARVEYVSQETFSSLMTDWTTQSAVQKETILNKVNSSSVLESFSDQLEQRRKKNHDADAAEESHQDGSADRDSDDDRDNGDDDHPDL